MTLGGFVLTGPDFANYVLRAVAVAQAPILLPGISAADTTESALVAHAPAGDDDALRSVLANISSGTTTWTVTIPITGKGVLHVDFDRTLVCDVDDGMLLLSALILAERRLDMSVDSIKAIVLPP